MGYEADLALDNSMNKFFQKIRVHYFSPQRLVAMLVKEFTQLQRDRLTFAMVICIPLMQLILFGFAINTNPKKMPTVIIANDHSEFTRKFITGLKNTDYFMVKDDVKSEVEAKKMLAIGKAQFIVTIPSDFTRKLLRKEQPQILLEADATDPVATGSATSAVNLLAQVVFNPQLGEEVESSDTSVNVVVHASYNPESITAYNIVPGLLGVVLTMTMVVITGIGITRERERGTMEHLLATPVRPLEVMLGKLMPYVVVGYIQVGLILLVAKYLFAVPFNGSVILLLFAALPFIAANLSIGLTFSSLARNQLQAAQMSTFFFLPSILLSGFMFPFRGMPVWAQDLGSILPLTYFLRIARGIILKGNGIAEVWPDFWPIVVFMVVSIFVALMRYRKTLD